MKPRQTANRGKKADPRPLSWKGERNQPEHEDFNKALKTSISVDTEQKVITGFGASKSRVHDTWHAEELLSQCHNLRKSDCYVMDRGYDSEAIHRLIREVLHADSVIPLRSWNADFVGGTYRQEMATRFNDIIYPRRPLVENKFSVLKRKFSGQMKETLYLRSFGRRSTPLRFGFQQSTFF